MTKKEFITKDSGQRKEFDSGMKRDVSENKDRPDLVYAPVASLIYDVKPQQLDLTAPVIQSAYDLVTRVQSYKDSMSRSEKIYLLPYTEAYVKNFVKHFVTWYNVTYGYDPEEQLEGVIGVMTRGAQKYDEHNWKKADGEAEYHRFAESFLRHLLQLVYEKEKEENHCAAVWFNIGGMLYVSDKLAKKCE